MKRLVSGLVVIAVAPVAGCGLADGRGGPTAPVSRTLVGYVAPWEPRSSAAMRQPPRPLTDISPVWYQPTDTGAVVFTSEEARESADGLRANPPDVRVVPSVSNFRDGKWDDELISKILRDPDRRARHLAALVAVARADKVAGVDLDYEALKPSDRTAYSSFVRDLASALDRVDRKLAVAVEAKTTESADSEGGGAEDWRELGAAVDELRIMAYDHSWPDSPPGPVAPLAWVDSVLSFAVTQVPGSKVLLGVATYGYDWPRDGTGRDVGWADAMNTAAAHRAGVRWDGTSQSPWFSYTDGNGIDHTVWFEDARSMGAKLALVRRYHLGGVTIWKLGAEDPKIWQELRAVA